MHCISQIVATAMADADSLVEHIDQLAEHLSALGCTTKADVEHYFLVANRTLVSLYFVARQPQPSPDELKRLALRYALDARRPVEGDLRRFEMRRLLETAQVNAIRASFREILLHHRSKTKEAEKGISNVELLDVLRKDPKLLSLFEPLLSQEQVEWILRAGDSDGEDAA